MILLLLVAVAIGFYLKSRPAAIILGTIRWCAPGFSGLREAKGRGSMTKYMSALVSKPVTKHIQRS
jgi:hypothetical protein